MALRYILDIHVPCIKAYDHIIFVVHFDSIDRCAISMVLSANGVLLAVQEHKRTSFDVHESLLLPGWQLLLNESPSPGFGGIGFLLSPRAVKTLLL